MTTRGEEDDGIPPGIDMPRRDETNHGRNFGSVRLAMSNEFE
jgi:hypothetical protein